jgi:hypothetical protein
VITELNELFWGNREDNDRNINKGREAERYLK